MWMGCFFGSLTILLVTAIVAFVFAKAKYSIGKHINSFNLLFGGVFLATLVLLWPIIRSDFTDGLGTNLKTLLLSIYHSIKIFSIDAETSDLMGHIAAEDHLASLYSVYLSVLFILAPILTFGFVLSLFKNASAFTRYLSGFFRDTYVFSELNERSYTLADSIKSRNPKVQLVFTDVFENNEENSYELIKKARERGAICFKKDMLAINFKLHSKNAVLSFFTIGADESENVNQALKLIETYRNTQRDREHTGLYVFSTRADSELLLSNVDRGFMKVRRINEVRSLVNRILYEQGHHIIFDQALPTENGNKQISAVVVGMGRHGREMTKALAWYSQMDGYRVKINAFEKDELAADKFSALCPELMSEDYNGVTIDGEAQYSIRIHSGIDVETKTFADEIMKLTDATYVLVALGTDEMNIKTAVDLRMYFERNGAKPIIQAIVYNTEEKEALTGIENYKHQRYDIDFIGDLKTSYSQEVIIDFELENEAFESHRRYCEGIEDPVKRQKEEDTFWQYEYNYRSSVATAIHQRARKQCGIPEEQVHGIEHRRWNAYMRAEGYIYSGSPDSSSRNDLGKLHHNLVPAALLSEADIAKDKRVGNKK